MIVNAFIGHTAEPTETELAAALGPAIDRWNEVLPRVRAIPKITAVEWNSYSPKAGWSLRVKAGKRNIVYLIPNPGAMTVAFIFGDRAIAAIRNNAGFPKKAGVLIDTAKHYPEGTGIQFEVKTSRDVALICKLVDVKLAY
ncbi:MAG: DUF3788 family protein [Acidobacteria bacterium]|nr:DUF3788 family protein [Acidobacteriota bacterium]